MISVETIIDKLATIVGALSAFGALIVSYVSLSRVRELHIIINSRMSELLKATGLASKAEGREEERKKQADGN